MSPYGESAYKTYGGLKGVKIWISHHRGLMQSECGRANPVFRMTDAVLAYVHKISKRFIVKQFVVW